jgi:hypothetical protein
MITLTPAYGRDYRSRRAVLADWEANRDFILYAFEDPWDGKPINRTQALESNLREMCFRYDRLRKAFYHVERTAE